MDKVELLLNRTMFNDLDKSLINDYHKEQILKILAVYDSKTIKNRLKNILDFIKYDVDGDWLGRINIIRNVLKNDVMSDYALEIRYGKGNVTKIKEELKGKVSHSLEIYIKKFGNIEGSRKWEEFKIKSITPWGLKGCVERYGDIEGPRKWEERLSKKINTMAERKVIKPYRNGRTLAEYQERCGIEDGYKKWMVRNKKQSYRFSKEYYINKFGEERGIVKWGEYKSSMDKTSLESFIERYGDKIGMIKYIEHINKLFNSGVFYSKISQEMFWLIHNKLPNDIETKFYENGGEEIIYVYQDNFKSILLDFKSGKKIIEFDGDYWHSKPEQIEKDKLRDEYLIAKGYEILRVKESDYKNNKEKTVDECLKFLNN